MNYHLVYREYKDVSGYEDWPARKHASEYLVFPENIGKKLSLDELSVSKGELYTFLTNKAAKGRKGALVASIGSTKTDEIVAQISRIPQHKRMQVQEVTLDMAENMAGAVRELFPNADLVIDRFHVEKLGHEVLQHLRVKLRWEAIEAENEAIKEAKKQGESYRPEVFHNGDTRKQLLARSRYALFKHSGKWTLNQQMRMKILFEQYPELKQAHDHRLKLNQIYKKQQNRIHGKEQLQQWIAQSKKHKIKGFRRMAYTIEHYLENIANFFLNRSTNASAESFNAKVKQFRAIQRGVTDTEFFLFCLSKIYA